MNWRRVLLMILSVVIGSTLVAALLMWHFGVIVGLWLWLAASLLGFVAVWVWPLKQGN